MSNFSWQINYFSKKSRARSGCISTPHGKIYTPAFIFCATKGALKSITTAEAKKQNTQIILSNTYHLMLQPGSKLISEQGGLHNFIKWDDSILTDSGGFQIYSLSNFRKIDNNGVEFRSHLDGSKHYFSPEKIIDIQISIGSDIMMVLDVCPDGNASLNVARSGQIAFSKCPISLS